MSVKSWLFEKLFGDSVKDYAKDAARRAWEALTLKGKKRKLGILIFVLSTLAAHYPVVGLYGAELLDFLKSLGADQYQNAGLATLVIGVVDWVRYTLKEQLDSIK